MQLPMARFSAIRDIYRTRLQALDLCPQFCPASWQMSRRLRYGRGNVILKAVPLLPGRTLLRTRIRPL
jgi:hypothetical protein